MFGSPPSFPSSIFVSFSLSYRLVCSGALQARPFSFIFVSFLSFPLRPHSALIFGRLRIIPKMHLTLSLLVAAGIAFGGMGLALSSDLIRLADVW